MKNIEFSIKEMEMECKTCANILLNKLRAVEDVKDVSVDPVTRKVRVESEDPTACSGLTCACGIDKLGYRVHVV